MRRPTVHLRASEQGWQSMAHRCRVGGQGCSYNGRSWGRGPGCASPPRAFWSQHTVRGHCHGDKGYLLWHHAHPWGLGRPGKVPKQGLGAPWPPEASAAFKHWQSPVSAPPNPGDGHDSVARSSRSKGTPFGMRLKATSQ